MPYLSLLRLLQFDVIIAAKKALSDQGPFDPATFDKPSVVLLAIGMEGSAVWSFKLCFF